MSEAGTSVGTPYDLAEDSYFRGDFQRAYAICVAAARVDDRQCQRLLGWMYLRGKGIAPDPVQALHWFTQAAAGDVEAVFAIGVVHYENGHYERAATQFEQARALGYVPAVRWLGVLYHLGLGVPRDVVVAEELYLDAASKGNLPAYLQHCLLLLHGHRGLMGRVSAIPKIAYFFFTTLRVAFKNAHSQRLM